MKIKLPFWMDKGELRKIADLFEKWWQLQIKRLETPLLIFDEEKCSEFILNLIAYQRDIERFENEPLSLFRKRVKYAYINAQEAGSVIGFKNIFERLGIGKIEIRERITGLDFDIIHLTLTDGQLSQNDQLIYEIIRKYGRTCRRYSFLTENTIEIYLHYAEFGHSYYCDELEIKL
ncbi:phage tail protein [Actinobacillus porcitonsillarum]|uniref:Phage tail protein n=1 Tax=Actinobacillus porcitonsillarum TaxID=189834 RepID=A0A2U8FLW8_9PAST|nr:phage tail protein [Actinobacillus porcitonsillarum]AWI51989.1 phage tail protein [Actinobacillus porcitonsillarum]